MAYERIIESEYGDHPHNFHVAKLDNELQVDLTYPPRTDADNEHDQCRYVCVNQESVRASDGVRLHYDFERDGFVVEQPQPRLKMVGVNSFEEPDDWIEVAFLKSWRFDNRMNGAGGWSAEAYAKAHAEYEASLKVGDG